MKGNQRGYYAAFAQVMRQPFELGLSQAPARMIRPVA